MLVDGIDISLIDAAQLRRQIGVVLQDNWLFNRSVRENIAIADPAAPIEAVMQAAQLAGAHEFVSELPEGYDTIVGEQGASLSRRPAPAHRHRPGAVHQPAHPDPRRSHQRARLRERSHHPAQHGRHLPGPHRDHHRAPAELGAPGAPHHRDGPGPHRRSRARTTHCSSNSKGLYAHLWAHAGGGDRVMSTDAPLPQRHPFARAARPLRCHPRVPPGHARRELAGPQAPDRRSRFPAGRAEPAGNPRAPGAAPRGHCHLRALRRRRSSGPSFGQVDIVAVAPGRIVVSERTKTIQPLEASVVKRVLVKDGDAVQAGQVLVELDATDRQADQASVQEQLKAAAAEEQRTRGALLQGALDKAGTPSPLRRPSAVDSPVSDATAQLQAEWQDISASLAKLDAEARPPPAPRSRTVQARPSPSSKPPLPIAQPARGRFQEPGRPGLRLRPRRPRPHAASASNRSATSPPSAPAWPKRRPP